VSGDRPVAASRQLGCGPTSDPCSLISESGSIEQDADVVMFIYRDDVYNLDIPRPGIPPMPPPRPTSQRSHLEWSASLFLDHYTKFANIARVQ